MPQSSSPDKRVIVLILGALMTLSPFAIDMYLPAFSEIADDFKTTPARIAFSVSSYFIGLGVGQLVYGPLLDRFGRKRPLYAGLVTFALASFACRESTSVEGLVMFRFLQASGGCVAWVAAMTLVRDYFTIQESVKVFSLLILILGLSPLLAPTIGGFITVEYGWRTVFLSLAAISAFLFIIVYFFLPSGKPPDTSVSLRPGPLLSTFWTILRQPQFLTYTLSGSLSFASLFIYVAGSPVIFREIYHLDPKVYGGIFALISIGFIGASQLNILLVRWLKGPDLYRWVINMQLLGAIVFAISAWQGSGLYFLIGMFFVQMTCVGIVNPNASALALAPFDTNLGTASALIGSIQITIAAIVSSAIGVMNPQEIMPIVAIMLSTTILARLVLLVGERITRKVVTGEPSAEAVCHM